MCYSQTSQIEYEIGCGETIKMLKKYYKECLCHRKVVRVFPEIFCEISG